MRGCWLQQEEMHPPRHIEDEEESSHERGGISLAHEEYCCTQASSSKNVGPMSVRS